MQVGNVKNREQELRQSLYELFDAGVGDDGHADFDVPVERACTVDDGADFDSGDVGNSWMLNSMAPIVTDQPLECVPQIYNCQNCGPERQTLYFWEKRRRLVTFRATATISNVFDYLQEATQPLSDSIEYC